MEHETYGKEAAWTVVDGDGKLVVNNVYQGFDQSVQQQIKDHLNPPHAAKEPVQQEIPFGQASIPVGADVPGDRKSLPLRAGKNTWRTASISAASRVGKNKITVL